MYSIFAKDISIIKKAGVYAEELRVENHFSVSLRLSFSEKPATIPDYEYLVDVVADTANQGFVWLEDWAENIFASLSAKHSHCTASLKISKLNPAFEKKFVAEVGVEFEREL